MSKNAPLESSVVNGLIRWINKQPSCKARKTHGSQYQSGTPDIDGSWRGTKMAIEVKRPGNNRVTALQQKELDEWAATGAIAGVVHSLEELKTLIREAECRDHSDGAK